MTEPFGPLVRLWGVQDEVLPPRTASGSELQPFLTSILLEATPFIDDVPSDKQSPFTSSWQSKGSKDYPHVDSPVYLYERTVPSDILRALARQHHVSTIQPASKMQDETWVLRRSVHKDSPTDKTASWDEWVKSFKIAHATTEREFTPSVVSTRIEHEWDCSGVEIDLNEETWTDWTLKLEESVHKLPTPLKKRVFPVLQATASVQGKEKFLVVQISAGDVTGMGQLEKGQTVLGAYTSIERVKETVDGIEWIMGTTSDAKGVLPPWMQRMALPGAVAKDVEMFLSWLPTQRKGQAQNGGSGGNDGSNGAQRPVAAS